MANNSANNKKQKPKIISKMENDKTIQKQNYMNSSLRKQEMKSVKHHEINLQRKDKIKNQSIRKAISTQKERILESSKLTAGIPKRQVGMLSNHKSRDKVMSKKNLYNSH